MLWTFELFLKLKCLKQKKFVNEREFDFNIFQYFIVVVDYFKNIIFCSNKFSRRKFFFSCDFFFNSQKTTFLSIFKFFFFFFDSRLLFERIDILYFSNCTYDWQQFPKYQQQSIKYSFAQKDERSHLIRKLKKFRSIDLYFLKNAAKILRSLICLCRFWKITRHSHKCVHCLSEFVICCNFFLNDLTFNKKNSHHVFFAHFFRFVRKKCC